MLVGAGDSAWKCANMSQGQKSLPDIQQELVLTQPKEQSIIGSFYLFHLPSHLSTSCNGVLSALKYCYQYENTTISVNEAVFNWTVSIVDKDFVIVEKIAIESHPSELNCHKHNGQQICCDTTQVIDLVEVPKEKFAFGVTASAQGNTHSATLLAFHGSLSEYLVNASIFPRVNQVLTKGSRLNVDARLVSPVGIRYLWFLIGK